MFICGYNLFPFSFVSGNLFPKTVFDILFMKTFLKIHPASFILGAVFAGVAVFAIGADSHHPTVWKYRVVEQDMRYTTYAEATEAIGRAQAATNGWEFVSAQIIPTPGDVFAGAKMWIIQRQPEQ